MKKIIAATFASASLLALAACGSPDEAATEAEAETVELPAEEAMEPVVEQPVADPVMTEPAVPSEDAANDQSLDEAGANAEEAAAAIAAAAAADAEEETE